MLFRSPALALAYAALRAGGASPAVLNAANEVAVAAFLAGKLCFSRIVTLVKKTLEGWRERPGELNLGAILTADAWARQEAARLLPVLSS